MLVGVVLERVSDARPIVSQSFTNLLPKLEFLAFEKYYDPLIEINLAEMI
jgi:hypothetical protein